MVCDNNYKGCEDQSMYTGLVSAYRSFSLHHGSICISLSRSLPREKWILCESGCKGYEEDQSMYVGLVGTCRSFSLHHCLFCIPLMREKWMLFEADYKDNKTN